MRGSTIISRTMAGGVRLALDFVEFLFFEFRTLYSVVRLELVISHGP